MYRAKVLCTAIAAASTYSAAKALYPNSPILAEKRPQPVVPRNRYDENVPGLYLWGNPRLIDPKNVDPVIRSPTRIEYFDGLLIKDIAIREGIAVAVLQNGEVVQWTEADPKPAKVAGAKKIERVVISNGYVYALLSSQREIVSWNGYGETQLTKLELPQLGYFESIKEFTAGRGHLAVLTSKGRVWTGSTGAQGPAESKGQFGIASYSQFDAPPKPGKLHEVVLVNKLGAKVEQIAAGDNHTLLRTEDGKAHAFGDNVYGQLGISFTYRTAQVGVPTTIRSIEQLFSNDAYSDPKVVAIAAGANLSYFTVESHKNREKVREYYALGNGLTGQLGTGQFIHAQPRPSLMKYFSNLLEYSEAQRRMVQIDVDDFSIGATHSFAGANSITEDSYGQDVLAWGGNEFSQLGTGKRNNLSTPENILPLDVERGKDDDLKQGLRMQLKKHHTFNYQDPSGKKRSVKASQKIYAGDNISAVYYTSA
ncbi:hypothetical protein TRVA0_023S01178 [Trichomonascus vanleenenianus]|uniref:Fmp25p n=1 Tax=Trichomonascus vanleenenianus TaxID=2268995 RepID=UPI003ECB4589